MKKGIRFITIIALVIGIIAIGLAWLWFGYKLIIVLLLFGWSMNIDNINRSL